MVRIVRIAADTGHLLGRIAEDVFDAAIDPAQLAEVTGRPDHLLFVALDGDLVVGQCLGMVLYGPDRAPVLYVDNLGVAPDHRRQGIATRLMAAVRAAGEARGAAWMWLGADPDSDSARPFYEALGMPMRMAAFTEIELGD